MRSLGLKTAEIHSHMGTEMTHSSFKEMFNSVTKGFSKVLLFHTNAQREKGDKKLNEKEGESVYML